MAFLLWNLPVGDDPMTTQISDPVREALEGLQQLAWSAEENHDAYTYDRAVAAKGALESLHASIATLEAEKERLRGAFDDEDERASVHWYGEWVAMKRQLAAERARVAGLEADAARYRWLRDSSACSLTLTHNDHHVVYESLADVLERSADDPLADYYSDVPADEKARMVASDSVWTLHVYPNTPVGFNVWHGATLDTAIDAALADAARKEGANV
jgi:hypothetical protein